MGNLYVDVNPRFGKSKLGELVKDVEAINSSIENIVGTTPGERLFLPQFGSLVGQLLFEPISDVTSDAILFEMMNAIELWEPRIEIVASESNVVPDPDNNQYRVTISYRIKTTGAVGTFDRFLVAS